MALAREMIENLAAELAAAGHGSKQRILEQHARTLGVSVSTLRRAVADESHRRKRRRDAGSTKGNTDWFEAVARWRLKNRSDDRNMLTVEGAIWAAEEAGEIPPGAVKEGAYLRWERASQVRGGGPVARFEAERSNELHQVDVSGAKILWVVGYDKDRQDYVVQFRKPGTKRLNRFADKHRARLWLCGVVDDHSRVRYAEYFVNPGESAVCVMNCLMNCWKGEYPRMVMRGLPDNIMADQGSFASSQVGKNFLAALNIKTIERMPYRSWVGGKVERPFRATQQSFEGRFRAMPSEKFLLGDVNSMLLDYLQEENNGRHPFWRDQHKDRLYLRDLGNVRQAASEMARIAWNRYPRTVGPDLVIWYENVAYKAPPCLKGKHVDLCINVAGDVVAEFEGRSYIVESFQPNKLGEYKAFADTLGEKLEKQAEDQELKYHAEAQSTQRKIVYAKAGGDEVVADTPFQRAIDAQRFETMEEAVKEVCWIAGLDFGGLDEEYRRAIEGQIGDDLRKDSVRDYARELKGRLERLSVAV